MISVLTAVSETSVGETKRVTKPIIPSRITSKMTVYCTDRVSARIPDRLLSRLSKTQMPNKGGELLRGSIKR